MCVRFTGKPRVTKKPIIAYKLTRNIGGEFVSTYIPEHRLKQNRCSDLGDVVSYKVGETVEVKDFPWIYLFVDKHAAFALQKLKVFPHQVLKVEIPVGSYVRRGKYWTNCIEYKTINASKIKVVKRVYR